MRVLFWGTYDTGKPRTRILRDGLRANGVEVEEIHASVWEGIEDKSQVAAFGAKLSVLLRWLLAYPRLLWRLARSERPDVILIGYPGLLDALLVATLARTRRIPVAWDVFLSLYDTICEDRRLLEPSSIAARMLRWLERAALRRGHLLFMDTVAHARRLERLFNLPEGSCDAVWVGVETQFFRPRAPTEIMRGRSTRVLFYGQFIPLHGIDTIVAAASLLRDQPIEWHLVGTGQEAGRIRKLLAEDPLPKVRWTEWLDYAQLNLHLADADLCLGIFGTSEKAASVIPNKVFQIVAAGRPLITRDSPAIRELLTPSPPCAYLVPPGDARALADAVLAYSRASPDKIAGGVCNEHLVSRIDATAIGRQFLDAVERRNIRA
jgi:glycosyltransferase involved in cell wall biosynthesis